MFTAENFSDLDKSEMPIKTVVEPKAYTLKSYQKESVEKHQQEMPYMLCAHEMGLGKTLIALDSLYKSGKKDALIVAPKSLLLNWKDEITKFLGVGCNIVDSRYKFRTNSINLCSYSRLYKLKDVPSHLSFLVADEAHFLKNYKAKRTQAFTEFVKDNAPAKVMLLTGTPMVNNAGDFYPYLNICSLSGQFEFPYADRPFVFLEHFCNVTEGAVRVRATGPYALRKFKKYTGVKNAEALRKLLSKCAHRVLLKDANFELPESTRIDVVINEKCSYDRRFERLIEDYLNSGGEKIVYMTEKRINATAKVPYTIERVEEIAGQTIVFTEHVEAAKAIAAKFKTTAVTGELRDEERDTLTHRFKVGEDRVLVATYRTLATGHNFVNCNYMVFNDLPFVPSMLEQAAKRIHRIGQKKACFYYYMFLSKMDQKLGDLITEKNVSTKEALGEK